MKKLLLITLFLLPFLSLAQTDYTPLAPIPELTNNSSQTNINTFIPGAIRLTIGVASGLAVLAIIVGGIQYMSSDAWNKKEDGKKTIQNALGGLLLAIGSYVILNTVNPQLLNFDITIEGQRGGNRLEVSTTTNGTVTIGSEAARAAGCITNCVPLANSGLSLSINSSCSTGSCYLNSELVRELQKLRVETNALNISWQVTEAIPPTDPHASPCHQIGLQESGRCVDIGLVSNTPAVIAAMISKILATDKLIAIYEACPNSVRDSLRQTPELRNLVGYVQCYSTTTGQHFHITLK